jgi:large subunit ribosomal protein L21
MYAIIETGGKQYRVENGDVLDVELDARSEADTIEFNNVLLVGGGDDVRVGDPHVADARVSAVAVAEVRAPKVLVFKKKRRKGYKRTQGHRQNLLRVRIEAIEAGASKSGARAKTKAAAAEGAAAAGDKPAEAASAD